MKYVFVVCEDCIGVQYHMSKVFPNDGLARMFVANLKRNGWKNVQATIS